MKKFKVDVQVNFIMYGTLEIEEENWEEVYDKIYNEENESVLLSVLPPEIKDLVCWHDYGEDGLLYIDDIVIWEAEE